MSGEVLRELERDKGGRPENSGSAATVSDYKQALEDSDTTYRDAHRWQKVAAKDAGQVARQAT